LRVVCLCSDVNKIREGIGDNVGNFLQFSATFVAGIVIGLAYGWKLALVVIAVSPLLAICGGLMTYVRAFFLCFLQILLYSFVLYHHDSLFETEDCTESLTNEQGRSK